MPRAARRVVTPKRSVDIAKVFPALAKLARPAIRLHPVRGKVPAESSHFGGSFLWPKDEHWPTTTAKQAPMLREFDQARMDYKMVRRANRTVVPIIQLRREDVPSFEFPEGTDLFQLLWNPRSHPAHGYGPQPCSLSPEEIVEYPCPLDLPRALRREIDATRRCISTAGHEARRSPVLQQERPGAAPLRPQTPDAAPRDDRRVRVGRE